MRRPGFLLGFQLGFLARVLCNNGYASTVSGMYPAHTLPVCVLHLFLCCIIRNIYISNRTIDISVEGHHTVDLSLPASLGGQAALPVCVDRIDRAQITQIACRSYHVCACVH